MLMCAIRRAAGVAAAWAALMAVASSATAQAPAKPAKWQDQPLNEQALDDAIKRGIEYLWAEAAANKNKEGNWEIYSAEKYNKEKGNTDADRKRLNIGLHSPGGIYSGQTALVLLAMLKAGVSQDDPKFQKAFKTIMEADPQQVYAHATRAALLASLDRPQKFNRAVEAEKDWLLAGVYSDGSFGYYAPPNAQERLKPNEHIDLSNTQYGVLGLWLISDYGYEVPEKFWQMIQNCYLSQQCKDGGWRYPGGAGPHGHQSMTLGGLASLFIVWDRLYTQPCDRDPPKDLVRAIDDGLKWLTKYFDPTGNVVFDEKSGKPGRGGWTYYTMYGIERVGVASGLKCFGEKNWWDLSARYVLFTQGKDGAWPGEHWTTLPPVTTAWAMIFLSYGRAPVVFNKLAYGSVEQWNNRPRDLARLTAWMSRSYEKLFNWQIMPIDRPVDELLDAPILLMSGKGAVALKDEQKAKLKAYVLGGGLLFGEASGNSKVFSDSFRALIRELFPELEMSALPPTHPIYTVQYQLVNKAGVVQCPPLEGLSNGVRTMVILSPRDIGCTWQENSFVSKKSYFELGANLTQYVSDKGSGLLARGTSYMVKDLGNKPAAQATVGRAAWGAKYQWDPEPMAWKRVDVLMRNAGLMAVATRETDLKAPLDVKRLSLLHLTGIGPVQLNDQQKANLKKYVQDGGLLLADAAGGNPAFADSFQKLAAELFGATLLPGIPPFLAAATDSGKVSLRHVGGLPQAIKPLDLLCHQPEPGRYGVVFLPYDLTAALTGHANVEPVGLTPRSAEKFIKALLAWKCGAAAPSTQP